jgi:hypothetical protein
MKYWKKYLRIVEQVAYDGGWPMNLPFTEAIIEIQVNWFTNFELGLNDT